MRITVTAPRMSDGLTPSYEVDLPAVPRIGEHISSDSRDFSGYVEAVSYWQDEKSGWFIEVRIK